MRSWPTSGWLMMWTRSPSAMNDDPTPPSIAISTVADVVATKVDASGPLTLGVQQGEAASVWTVTAPLMQPFPFLGPHGKVEAVGG